MTLVTIPISNMEIRTTRLEKDLQSVSGAVGTAHRQRSMASMTRMRGSASPSGSSPSGSPKSKYRRTSSTFWPLQPQSRHPSTSPSQGFVTLSNQPGSDSPSPDGGGAQYARARGNMAR